MPTDDVDFAQLYRRIDEAQARLASRSAPSEAREREILAERAQAVAAVRGPRRGGAGKVLVFAVAGERFALGLEEIVLVLGADGLCAIPGFPPWLLGTVIARSRIVPVLDLRPLLRLGGGGLSDLTRVVVARHGEHWFGIAVEVVEDEREVDEVAPIDPDRGPFRWVAPDRVARLDPAHLFVLAEQDGGASP